MSTDTFPIVLKETYMLSSSVKHFRFQSKLHPAFNFIAGQFIRVLFEHEGKQLRRSYSIANPPQNDNYLEFAASYVKDGPGTDYLFNLKIGDEVLVNGPYGKLILKEDMQKRYILVATSTGVTPYRAMLPELASRVKSDANFKCAILQGVQKHQDILYNNDFVAFADSSPGQAEFHAFLSRETNDNLAPNQHKGHVQDGFAALNLNPQQDIVYLCGNPAMIDDSFNLLQEQGFTTQNIIREKYISSK
jgi:NAD(P)H-flavin reductase